VGPSPFSTYARDSVEAPFFSKNLCLGFGSGLHPPPKPYQYHLMVFKPITTEIIPDHPQTMNESLKIDLDSHSLVRFSF
jgi:hypothetical protein